MKNAVSSMFLRMRIQQFSSEVIFRGKTRFS